MTSSTYGRATGGSQQDMSSLIECWHVQGKTPPATPCSHAAGTLLAAGAATGAAPSLFAVAKQGCQGPEYAPSTALSLTAAVGRLGAIAGAAVTAAATTRDRLV